MKCPTEGCGEVVTCPEHGDTGLDYFPPEDGAGPEGFISCGPCVEEYGSPIGSVLHFCGPTLAERLASITEADILTALNELRVEKRGGCPGAAVEGREVRR